uniref:Uncharacterized protein n=1 Tax=Lepeophtheirus salmonis TaxID=72036 RepID=A0A0K2V4R8_LEPSM
MYLTSFGSLGVISSSVAAAVSLSLALFSLLLELLEEEVSHISLLQVSFSESTPSSFSSAELFLEEVRWRFKVELLRESLLSSSFIPFLRLDGEFVALFIGLPLLLRKFLRVSSGSEPGLPDLLFPLPFLLSISAVGDSEYLLKGK